jgi:hypothetical protein
MHRATLAISAVLLVACAGGSPKPRAATPAATETSVAATPAPRAAKQVPTTAEDAFLEKDARDCITPGFPDDTPGATSGLDACLNRGEGGYHVVGIEGGLPLILVERLEDPGLCRAHSVIVWMKEGWHIQNATVLLPDPVNDRLLGQYSVPPFADSPQPSAIARQTNEGDALVLSVLVGVASCGSGPGTVPMLFALNGDTWHLAWDPRGTELETLTDPRADFADTSGIEHIHVRGAMWCSADPAGKIFAESHPGPHRYADETWTRDGERYVLSASRIEPSAYNTLLNFVDRLSTGDDAAAQKFLADVTLLETAKRLGLVQQPLGQQWVTNLDPTTECCGPIHILSGPEWKNGPPQPIVVTFEQRGADWLVASIAAE